MDLDARIANWVRAYRDQHPLHTCGSAEKHWRAPWRQWVALQDLPPSSPVDLRDAERVEAAWRALRLRDRLLLRWHYMRQAPVWLVCRRSGVKRWHFEAALQESRRHLGNRLTYGEYCR